MTLRIIEHTTIVDITSYTRNIFKFIDRSKNFK